MRQITIASLIAAATISLAPTPSVALSLESALRYCDRDYQCRISMRRLDLLESYQDYTRAIDKEIASYDRRAKIVCGLAGTTINELSGGTIKRLVRKALRNRSLRRASERAQDKTKDLYLDLRGVEAGLRNQRARRYIERARREAREQAHMSIHDRATDILFEGDEVIADALCERFYN